MSAEFLWLCVLLRTESDLCAEANQDNRSNATIIFDLT